MITMDEWIDELKRLNAYEDNPNALSIKEIAQKANISEYTAKRKVMEGLKSGLLKETKKRVIDSVGREIIVKAYYGMGSNCTSDHKCGSNRKKK